MGNTGIAEKKRPIRAGDTKPTWTEWELRWRRDLNTVLLPNAVLMRFINYREASMKATAFGNAKPTSFAAQVMKGSWQMNMLVTTALSITCGIKSSPVSTPASVDWFWGGWVVKLVSRIVDDAAEVEEITRTVWQGKSLVEKVR
jgi:hypothetical protein